MGHMIVVPLHLCVLKDKNYFAFFLDFYASETQDAGVTKSLQAAHAQT